MSCRRPNRRQECLVRDDVFSVVPYRQARIQTEIDIFVTCLKTRSPAQKTACDLEKTPYLSPCPNRTCLWSCVGGWGSGQEAGEPSVKTGSRSEPVNPAKRGTRLKATTDRAFSSLSVSKADVMKRLVFLAGRAERELIPIQSMASATLAASAAWSSFATA